MNLKMGAVYQLVDPTKRGNPDECDEGGFVTDESTPPPATVSRTPTIKGTAATSQATTLQATDAPRVGIGSFADFRVQLGFFVILSLNLLHVWLFSSVFMPSLHK